MFQMRGVFAEFGRGMIRERVNAGPAGARANGAPECANDFQAAGYDPT